MAKVSLKVVGRAALKDKTFFNGLVSDMDGTLAASDMQLTSANRTTLKRSLAGTPLRTTFDVPSLVRLAQGLSTRSGGWDNPDWNYLRVQGAKRRRKARAHR
jgi:hypothetical protein